MSEALRKAAEQAILAMNVVPAKIWIEYGLKDVSNALRAALAEPEQSEPVAYELYAAKFANGQRLVYKVPEFLASYVNVRPLYAAPPRREPLTEKEIMFLWKTSEHRGSGGQFDWFEEGIRVAERHHGIGVKP